MLQKVEQNVEHISTKAEHYTDIAINFATEYGLKLIGAIAIFLIGKWIAGQIIKLMRRGMERAHVDATLISFSSNVVYVALIIAVVVASASNLGINTSSFIAIFGAAGLAIGLALKDTLANVGAAVLIIFFRPFKVGDSIEVSGVNGTVEVINLFSTTLATADNRTIIIPNGTLVAGNIINNTGKSNRRIDMVFDIDYKDDLKVAKEVISEVFKNHPKILAEPAFMVSVGALGANSVQLYARPWVLVEDYWDVRFAVTEEIKLKFDEHGITVPFPQMVTHVKREAI
ncbi:MAG: mechanosensitive ion channel [Sulfuricurvum sp.]|uniref:mechanosensitive ion channel family protein n=1 Tax=Sulfuricurvum sp. TaxID=2025608 RepID=UPI00261EFAFB|nr:mechanosensitive ion channel domain-containing protein [Sulfuricurvum sp.]MDD2828356.1 mechanosensitive ion channel [Sulfuricurvum sp.]MDD4949361.1 mechanosensitive ion channel [Sulfuricurvum sp.]